MYPFCKDGTHGRGATNTEQQNKQPILQQYYQTMPLTHKVICKLGERLAWSLCRNHI